MKKKLLLGLGCVLFLGAGCANERPEQDFFSRKQACAKELKRLEVESAQTAKELGSFPASHEVCYSSTLDTCIDFQFYTLPSARPSLAAAIATDIMTGVSKWSDSVMTDFKSGQYVTVEQITELRSKLQEQKRVLGCIE